MDKNVRMLRESDPGKGYRILKRMGSLPGDDTDDGSFSLPGHIIEGLSYKQLADRIAQYFADISQKYPPLNINNLPIRVIKKLRNIISILGYPVISEKLVMEKIKSAKNTRGGVRNDIPCKLLKKVCHAFLKPVTQIFNTIVRTGDWPTRWKCEEGITLKKANYPLDESDIRIISLTPFLSKTFEKIVLDWILEFIGDQIDWGQYGGAKGNSVSHYLIEFLTFIEFNQDLREKHAVIATMIDFSKAFNNQNHNILITKLSDMGIPCWLLKVVMGFLTDRKLILNYKGEQFDVKSMP